MNQKVRKAEIKSRVRDKLKKKRIVIGGNGKGHPYSKKYHLFYKLEIVDKVVDALIDVIVDIIEDGDTAVLDGLVKFEPQIRKERLQINPYTKEVGTYPEHYIVKATIGQWIRDASKRLTEKTLNETTAAHGEN